MSVTAVRSRLFMIQIQIQIQRYLRARGLFARPKIEALRALVFSCAARTAREARSLALAIAIARDRTKLSSVHRRDRRYLSKIYRVVRRIHCRMIPERALLGRRNHRAASIRFTVKRVPFSPAGIIDIRRSSLLNFKADPRIGATMNFA